MRRVLQFSAALALSIAINASAQVYRWVDERGVVNYGSRPPAGSKARQVDAEAGQLSVIPAPKPAAAAPGSAEQAAVRERVGRHEAQLDEERRQRALAQADEAERLARARAACEAERRIDCDSDPYGLYEPSIVGYPVRRPVVVKPRPPQWYRPSQVQIHRDPPAPMPSHIPYRRQPGGP